MTLISNSIKEIRLLLALATPMTISLILGSLVGLLDTLTLGELGTPALAAMSLTYSGLILGYCFLYGMSAPMGVRIGQAMGADDNHKVALVLRGGVWLGGLMGALSALLMIVAYAALPYIGQPSDIVAIAWSYWVCTALALIPYNMRFCYRQFFEAVHRPWLGVGLMAFVLTVKYIANTLLVPKFGILGAGLGTLAAETAGLVAVMVYYYRNAWGSVYRLPSMLSIWPEMKAQFKDGWPLAFQYVLEGGAMIAASLMLGWLGAVAMAANQVVMGVSVALYMPPLGIASAVSIRIAWAMGAKEQSRLRPIGLAGIGMVSLWMVAFTVLYVLGGAWIAAEFSHDPVVIQTAALMFIFVGLMQIADGVQSVALGVLRGMLDVHWPARVSIFCYWLVALPLSYFLAFHTPLGAGGIWGGFALGLLLAAGLLFKRFWGKSKVIS